MGVRKFRTAADMPGPEPRPPLDPENLRIAFGLMAFALRLAGVIQKPGVRRFRSWNDALAWHAERDQAREPRRAVDGRRSTTTRGGSSLTRSPSSTARRQPA